MVPCVWFLVVVFARVCGISSVFVGWTFCLDLNSIQSPCRVFTSFGVLFVDIVLPVVVTEDWNIWFEFCDGGYQSHYIFMTLCDGCPTAKKDQYEWVFCKLFYLDFHIH